MEVKTRVNNGPPSIFWHQAFQLMHAGSGMLYTAVPRCLQAGCFQAGLTVSSKSSVGTLVGPILIRSCCRGVIVTRCRDCIGDTHGVDSSPNRVINCDRFPNWLSIGMSVVAWTEPEALSIQLTGPIEARCVSEVQSGLSRTTVSVRFWRADHPGQSDR